MASHFHYIIQGFESYAPDGLNLIDAVTIDVIVRAGEKFAEELTTPSKQRPRAAARKGIDSATTMEEFALERAAQRVRKNEYRVSSVIEHDTALHAEASDPGSGGAPGHQH